MWQISYGSNDACSNIQSYSVMHLPLLGSRAAQRVLGLSVAVGQVALVGVQGVARVDRLALGARLQTVKAGAVVLLAVLAVVTELGARLALTRVAEAGVYGL